MQFEDQARLPKKELEYTLRRKTESLTIPLIKKAKGRKGKEARLARKGEEQNRQTSTHNHKRTAQKKTKDKRRAAACQNSGYRANNI